MPGLLLLLTRTEPGLAPVPGTSPWGELAVGPVFPTLEQLPVDDPFPSQSQVQEAAEGTWAAPACLGSVDPTGEGVFSILALCWVLNLVEIAGFDSRATHQQPVLPVTLCLAASLELRLEENTAASVDA